MLKEWKKVVQVPQDLFLVTTNGEKNVGRSMKLIYRRKHFWGKGAARWAWSMIMMMSIMDYLKLFALMNQRALR